MERNRLTDYVEEHYPDYTDKILLADGFEDAFIGVVESFGNEPKACYNYDACIDILMGEPDEEELMTYDEAVEYLEFNVTQAYVGEHTPAFIMNVALGEQKL
jgi:hypothetical protein